MAYKRKRKSGGTRRAKKRRFWKKKRFSRYKAIRYRPIIGGFPQKKLVKLRFATTFTLDAGVGSWTSKIIRCNNLYDPDASLGGHQPIEFDRWSSIYHKHVVIGANITASFHNSSGTSVAPSYVGIKLITEPGQDHLSNILSDLGERSMIAALQEQPLNNTYRTMVGSVVPSQNAVRRVRMKWSLKKHFPGAKLSDTYLQGTGNGGPTEENRFQIYQIAPEIGANPGAVHVNVVCDYLAVFFDKLPSQKAD